MKLLAIGNNGLHQAVPTIEQDLQDNGADLQQCIYHKIDLQAQAERIRELEEELQEEVLRREEAEHAYTELMDKMEKYEDVILKHKKDKKIPMYVLSVSPYSLSPLLLLSFFHSPSFHSSSFH